GSRSRGSAPRRPASGRVRRRKGAPMADFEGVFVPITTPFRADDVAPERLQSNLRRWNATALKGYVVLGSTGEFPMLSEAERDQILIASRAAMRIGEGVHRGDRHQLHAPHDPADEAGCRARRRRRD